MRIISQENNADDLERSGCEEESIGNNDVFQVREGFKTLSINNLDLPVYMLETDEIDPTKPTVIRFSNHGSNTSRNYLIQECYGAECNILDVPNIPFGNLSDIATEAIRVITMIESELGVDVVALEAPFSNIVRLSHLFRQLQIDGHGIQVLCPEFEESDRTANLRHREVLDYNFFRTKFAFDVEFHHLTADPEEEKTKKSCIIRYSNHAMQERAKHDLEEVYGETLTYFDLRDVKFPDAVTTKKQIADDIRDCKEQGYDVRAIELIAPSHIISQVCYDGFLNRQGIDLIQPKFERGEAVGKCVTVPDRITRGFSGRIGEVLEFKEYKKLLPSLAFIDLLKPNDKFVLPSNSRVSSLRPFASDEGENKQRLGDLQVWMEKLLNLMAWQRWQDALALIQDESVKVILEKAGLELRVISRKIDSHHDFERENDSRFENGVITVEYQSLSDDFRDELESRSVDIDEIEQALNQLNIFAFAEEILHALQINRVGHHLLSTKGEQLYSNPYIAGNSRFTKDRYFSEKPEEVLALEYDILCIYSDFGIPVPPLVWYGYKRMDILHLILGRDYQNVALSELNERISALDIDEELIVDEGVISDFDRGRRLIGLNKGEHAVITKLEDGYAINYPEKDYSGWGIFYVDNDSYWQEIPSESDDYEETVLPVGSLLRIGPSIEIYLN